MRPGYRQALAATGALRLLRAFDPHVAGTPPLGLDLPSSDIDILCHAPDANAFSQAVWAMFGAFSGFSLHQWTSAPRPVIARFMAEGWAFEVFGMAQPVREQMGWRHFVAERRLLKLGGYALRDAVMARSMAGLKTEPAFAETLGLRGDAFALVAGLSDAPDAALVALLHEAGYASRGAPPGTDSYHSGDADIRGP